MVLQIVLLVTLILLVGAILVRPRLSAARGADWVAYGPEVLRTGNKPGQQILSPAAMAELHMLWLSDPDDSAGRAEAPSEPHRRKAAR